jgi:hypothetical protein
MDRSRLCILIPTCDRYLEMACFTRKMIDRLWPEHPPVFMCGLPTPPQDAAFLASDADPRDWAGGVRCATRELLDRGFDLVYVILDDHPPFGPCNARHLNETLPRLARELSAACISLLGWGQGQQPVQGETLGADHYWMQRVSEQHLWKFSLHPGLWSLSVLDGICEWLVCDSSLAQRSAWAFERRCGPANAPLPEEWKRGTYRVYGSRMISPLRQARFTRLRLERLFCHAIRHTLISLKKTDALVKFDSNTRHLFRYYEGAYPMVHSGVLVKGTASPCAIRFIRRHGVRVFRSGLNGFFSKAAEQRTVST